MVPAYRCRANKAKANGHFSLGDLVLTKVKGFLALLTNELQTVLTVDCWLGIGCEPQGHECMRT